MKYSVLAILCLALAIAVLMGLKTRQVPRPREAVEKASSMLANQDAEIPVESSETGTTFTVQGNINIGETSPYHPVVSERRHDLSPRLISVITNQLSRLGRLEEETYDQEDWHNLEFAKMDYVQGWATALLRYAAHNGGKCPETLGQAADFYPAEYAWLSSVFDAGRFEIVYRGSLNSLRDPQNVILVRERVPAAVSGLLQHWWKAYIYANGKSGMVAGFQSTDEFQTFESQHLANGGGG
jgi:hypothetical protein